MKFSERFQKITNKIEFLKTHDMGYKPIRYTFKGTVAIEKIKEFERKYNVVIPDEYIEFITILGVGVAFGDGIFPPEKTLEMIGGLMESEVDLQRDFPFNNADTKVIIEKDISDRKYHGEDVDFITGCLTVDEDELGYMTVLLVLNGEQKGKVWKCDEYGRLIPFYKITSLGYEQMTFLDFYEDWIDHIFKWLKYDPNEEPENLNDVKYLAFKGENLVQVPAYTLKCPQLEKLYICNTNIEKIPDELFSLKDLEYLGVEYSQISALPENIGQLNKLKYIHMLKNNITSLPESLFMLNFLEIMDLKCNKLTNIPENINKLKKLKELNIHENSLKELPSSIGNISTLEILDISDNDLYDLPESFLQLKNIKELDISGNKRMKVSNVLHILLSLKSLEKLTISKSQMDINIKLDNVIITTIMN